MPRPRRRVRALQRPADVGQQQGGAHQSFHRLRQIGRRLYLAEKTVKNHISRLLAKLGVERRIQAAVIATQAQDRLRHVGR